MRITPIAFTGTFNIKKLNQINIAIQKDITMVSATEKGDAQIAKILMKKGFAFEYSPEIIKGPQNSLELLSTEDNRIISQKKKD